MEINEFHHSDSVWTWRPNPRRHKASLWLPYFEKVVRLPKGKGDRYTFYYKGGELTCHLKQIDFLMFYGASGIIEIEFLDKLNSYKIPLMIHRRNMSSPYLFFPEKNADFSDILSAQIIARTNQTKCCYVARTLIRERMYKFEKFFFCSGALNKLKKSRSIEDIRVIEAMYSRAYWRKWFEKIGFPEVSRRQEEKHPVNEALDASSFFFYGIMLRWILFHKLSPYHGFMHQPGSYASLVYDLIEPYRYIIEDTVFDIVKSLNKNKLDCKLTALTLNTLKNRLDEMVYVPSTRQTVKQKNLLHGIVLSLRSYLLGQTQRFVVPMPGKKNGGRPLKLGFRLPG